MLIEAALAVINDHRENKDKMMNKVFVGLKTSLLVVSLNEKKCYETN